MKKLLCLFAAALMAVQLGCPSPFLQRQVDVDFLWVRTAGGRPTGQAGTTKARIVLSPNPGGDVRVGVLEESPGSIGEMWRAAVWLAAVMSAMHTGQSLAETKLTVEANGFIDGPSAGSLMTAAMIAARRGDPVLSDVTMTGTVNPDGSIGPVGGLVEKIRAAMVEGKKTIGYPIGQGRARDLRTGRIVNLVKLAQSRGAQAIEIDDIHAAYALLTRREIERPEALDIRDMRMPPALHDLLQRRAQAWLEHAQANLAAAGTARMPELIKQWQSVQTHIGEMRRYLSRGEVAAAYWLGAGTAIDADVAARLTAFVHLLETQGVGPAVATLAQLLPHVDQRFRALAARLKKRSPETVDRVIREVDALEAAVASDVFLRQARGGYAKTVGQVAGLVSAPRGRSPEGLSAALRLIHGPVRTLVVANIDVQIASDTMESGYIDQRSVRSSETQREQLTELFTRAAQANLHYFDNVYLAQLARSRGVSEDVALKQFSATNPAYFTARASITITDIPPLGYQTTAQKLSRLAAAMSSFFTSSSLIAQYESLQVTRDPATGAPIRVGRERVFWRMLALAERKAREHGATARDKTGSVPIAALVAYQIGRVYQQRPGLEDKLTALEQFWRASMWSQLATHLASGD